MAQINKPDTYFNTKLYTGNSTGSTEQSITGLGFSPDMVWLKSRTDAEKHSIADTVRGATKTIHPHLTDAEETSAGHMVSFDSDGYTVGVDNFSWNKSGSNYASWCWRGSDSSAASNNDGSITSTVSANTTSGFSIVSYTGNGSSGATIGHGLGVAPSMIIIKNRDRLDHWVVYHKNLTSNNYYLRLNLTNSQTSGTEAFNDTSPTSSVFSLGNWVAVNGSTEDHIAYCFAEKKGFSKFGSYTGNGNNSDGTFVYTGFKPAWVMIKRTDTAGAYWVVMDSVRSPYNEIQRQLYPSITDAEYDNATNNADFLSNGFKLYHSGTPAPDNTNASGGTYIYMCFAENPLVGTNNIPATAR